MGPSERSESRLCGFKNKSVKAPGQRERKREMLYASVFMCQSDAMLPWSCLLCPREALDLYPHQMPHYHSQADHCPGYRYNA